MGAEALFANGGLRVRSKVDGPTLGFVWVEPAPSGQGQLQRWVLTKLLDSENADLSYVFERWSDAPATLDGWKKAVRKAYSVDPNGRFWGTKPTEHGLWPVEGGFYVVAESRVVTPVMKDGAWVAPPEPRYPRRDVVANLRAAHHATSGPGGEAAQEPAGETTVGSSKRSIQTGIPLVQLYQKPPGMSDILVGYGGGQIESHISKAYFEGEEMFLLMPNYRRAGTQGIVTRWAEKPDMVESYDRLYRFLETKWEEGSRFEVTGCNYYHGGRANPPDPAFL